MRTEGNEDSVHAEDQKQRILELEEEIKNLEADILKLEESKGEENRGSVVSNDTQDALR